MSEEAAPITMREARQHAVDALLVLVEHFCYSEAGLQGVAADAWAERRGGHEEGLTADEREAVCSLLERFIRGSNRPGFPFETALSKLRVALSDTEGGGE